MSQRPAARGKPHIEFMNLDMDAGWETPPGYPDGMQQKVLTSDLDETNKVGSRSRFLRIQPGAFSTPREQASKPATRIRDGSSGCTWR